MPGSESCLDDDAFWEAIEPVLFEEGRRPLGPAEEVERLVALLGLGPGARVLDLPCGIGRHAVELARRRFRVTGVDRTRRYLERAAEHAAREGLALELVRDDMRSFCRPGAFDAVLSLHNSFTYFADLEDDRRFLTNVSRSLAPGGALAMHDLFTKETVARSFHLLPGRWWIEAEGVLVLQETDVVDHWSRMDCRWVVVRDGRRAEYRFAQRLYALDELVALVRACGFARVETYADLGGQPFDHRAHRLILVGRT